MKPSNINSLQYEVHEFTVFTLHCTTGKKVEKKEIQKIIQRNLIESIKAMQTQIDDMYDELYQLHAIIQQHGINFSEEAGNP